MRRASQKIVIEAVLSLSGKYEVPGVITLRGYDAYGQPMEETTPNQDWERLGDDAEAILQQMGL